MIRVLITGAGSYIGTRLAAQLMAQEGRFAVRELDVKAPVTASDFAGVDAVVHVAGVAHQKERAENAALYQQVNCELALQIARMARDAGVRQFVFFSSMSVYGLTTGRVTANTRPAPNTLYGRSKWAAEQGLAELASDAFRVAVLRPPMVYGRGCRGNYPRLAALAQSLPVFPRVKNERSMVYIGTLCRFVQALLESGQGGLFFPQNSAYVNTSELAREVARCHGKRLLCVPGFAWLLRLLEKRVGVVGKVFGTLTYDMAMSTAFPDADEPSFAQSVRFTEVGS